MDIYVLADGNRLVVQSKKTESYQILDNKKPKETKKEEKTGDK